MKAVVAAFNQEKALVGAFSVLTNLRMELFQALILMHSPAVDPPEKLWKLIISVPLLVLRYDLVRPDGGQGHVPVKLAQHRQPDVLGVAPADGT